jgi:hypothetical protein
MRFQLLLLLLVAVAVVLLLLWVRSALTFALNHFLLCVLSWYWSGLR